MEAGVVLLILGLGLLSGSAVLAFAWAARDGQLEDLEGGARVIFEEGELNHGEHGGSAGSVGFDADSSNLHALHGKSPQEDRG
jgi:cbb3-type cytochrome oxidase maturation protein